MISSLRDWRRSRLLAATMAAVILAWIAGRIANGGTAIVRFDGMEEDGVFQFYNALRRIADGQHPGVDFQLFHGLGLPYLHYPLFAAFGQTLVAAEWIRIAVSAIIYPLSILVLCRAYARRWTPAWVLTVVALGFSRYLESLFAPGNSMLSVRAFAPVLVAAAMTTREPRRRIALCASALALSLLLGIEQGVAALLAFMVATLVASRPRSAIRSVSWLFATYALVALMMLGAMVVLVGWAGTGQTLRYQLRDIPTDQVWYFGVPPNSFLGSWSDFRHIWIAIAAAVVSIIIVGVKLCSDRKVPLNRAKRSTAVIMLLLYGVFACGSYVGILSQTYQTVVERSLLLVVILEAYAFAVRHTPVRRYVERRLASARVRTAAAATLLVVLAIAAASIAGRTRRIVAMRHEPVLSKRLERDLRTADSTLHTIVGDSAKTAHVWSTYTGLFDAERGSFQPAPDYIIHALGVEGRAKYLRDFTAHRAVMVLTELPAEFPYEEWLQTTSWPFYELLLRQYHVAGHTSHRMLWRRVADAEAPPPASIELRVAAGGAGSVLLPDPSAGRGVVQVVQMEYVATNTLRRAPVIGGMPRFLIDVSNAVNHIPITLPPHGGTVVFPVYRDDRRGVALSARVASLFPGARLRITGARVHEWRLAGADTLLIPPR